MKNHDTGQLTAQAAQVYDDFFVPALFAAWTGSVLDAAGVSTGDQVLDVACGTGILARAAAGRIREQGSVAGLDINEGMLAVAMQNEPSVRWRQGRAEALPYPNEAFDVVISQFGLMFFEDRCRALQEMERVLKPGGRMAIAVWDALDASPGYAALERLLCDLFGEAIAGSLQAPFALGNPARLMALFSEAGIDGFKLFTHKGIARFPSMQDWIYTEIRGWTLAGVLDDAQFERLLHEAGRALHPYTTTGGQVAFPISVHIVRWRKP